MVLVVAVCYLVHPKNWLVGWWVGRSIDRPIDRPIAEWVEWLINWCDDGLFVGDLLKNTGNQDPFADRKSPVHLPVNIQSFSYHVLYCSINTVPTPPGKSWEVLDFFSSKFQDLESPGKARWSWKLKFKVLESPGKIVATRCRMLRLKFTIFNFGSGSTPDPTLGSSQCSPSPPQTPPWGAHSAPPDPLAGFKGSH